MKKKRWLILDTFGYLQSVLKGVWPSGGFLRGAASVKAGTQRILICFFASLPCRHAWYRARAISGFVDRLPFAGEMKTTDK
jgi:hypothetical protein